VSSLNRSFRRRSKCGQRGSTVPHRILNIWATRARRARRRGSALDTLASAHPYEETVVEFRSHPPAGAVFAVITMNAAG
jgi:hypothetical protein